MESASWQDYFQAMGEVANNSRRRLAAILRTPQIWLVWPLHALLLCGAGYQTASRAFLWVIPESFPFQSVAHFQERFKDNPIDAPQVILDWITAWPFDAGMIPVWCLGIMALAATLEVIWLSALMGKPLRPSLGRSLNAAWQWLVLQLAFALIFLPVAFLPLVIVGRSLLLGQGSEPGPQMILMVLGVLAASLWAMCITFVWGLVRQWLRSLWLPLRLLMGGSMSACWDYGKLLAKSHWRGLVAFTVIELALVSLVGFIATAIGAILGVLLNEHALLRDLLAAAILLPLWAWMRLLGPSALGRLHESLAATPELSPPPAPMPAVPPPLPIQTDS